MTMIVTTAEHCARPGCARRWPRDPVLEVVSPDCGAPIGARFRRSSVHARAFPVLHAARDRLADASGAYGPCPLGLYDAANRPSQGAFAF